MVVVAWRVTELGSVAVCRDADQDYAAEDVDCNDNNPNIRPGAAEACDGYDNDCDSTTDEGFSLQTDPSNCGTCGNVCAIPGPGLPAACSAGSCVLPEPAIELCDGFDNDLDGQVDEDFDVGRPCAGCRGPELGPIPGIMECTEDGQGTVCVCP